MNAFTGLSPRMSGILIMAAGVSILPFMDAIGKILVADMPAAQIAFVRNIWQALFAIVSLICLGRLAALNARPFWPNIVRGILFASASVMMFSAYKVMGIAEAMAIFFVEPLILALMSAAFLGEKVGATRYAAILAGFAGALLIIQPGWDAFGLYTLLPLGASFLFACYLLMTRMISVKADPFAMQCIAGLSGATWLALVLTLGTNSGISYFTFVPITLDAFWLLALAGAIGFTGHLAIVIAFSKAPASLLAPIGYVELPISVVIGYLIFQDLPGALAFVGIALVALAGLYVLRGERKAGG